MDRVGQSGGRRMGVDRGVWSIWIGEASGLVR
jgi:hypothetical protein